TGVACYRHTRFPENYRGGMFALDWTFGRVYFLPLERSGSTYTGRPEVFLEPVGDNGFAPTAVVVHPDSGDLYVSIGGRGTRGAVYRVRYVGKKDPVRPAATRSLNTGPEPLDWQPSGRDALLRRATGGDALERLRALTAVRRHRQHLDDKQV